MDVKLTANGARSESLKTQIYREGNFFSSYPNGDKKLFANHWSLQIRFFIQYLIPLPYMSHYDVFVNFLPLMWRVI